MSWPRHVSTSFTGNCASAFSGVVGRPIPPGPHHPYTDFPPARRAPRTDGRRSAPRPARAWRRPSHTASTRRAR